MNRNINRQAPPTLDEKQLATALQGWPGCSQIGGGIEKPFNFPDLAAASNFTARVALLAERQDHHPERSNAWNKVHIRLSTHESSGLTERDIERANAIEEALQS